MISPSHRVQLLALVAILILSGIGPAQNQAATVQGKKWTMVWSDEFNEPNGSAVDPSKWVVETGGDGWGNNELEYYTDRTENARLENGNLVIAARAEKYKGADGVSKDYTSARIKTLGKFARTYGRFESRLKMPAGGILDDGRRHRPGRLARLRRDRHHGKYREGAFRQSRIHSWPWVYGRRGD